MVGHPIVTHPIEWENHEWGIRVPLLGDPPKSTETTKTTSLMA